MIPIFATAKLRLVSCALAGLLCFTGVVDAQSLSDGVLDGFRYREIGPTRPGGRVVSFSVARQDPYVFFVGAGPGGLWKTVNNGHSFTAVFDHEGTSGIGDVAVAPSDMNIVWVGTGEANLRNSTEPCCPHACHPRGGTVRCLQRPRRMADQGRAGGYGSTR